MSVPRTQLKVQENFPRLIAVFQVLQLDCFPAEEIAVSRQLQQLAAGGIKEPHFPIVKRSVVDFETGNQHDLVVSLVGGNSLVGGFDNFVFTLKNLQERTILVKQHARDGVTVIIASCGQQQVLQFTGREVVFRFTGVD